MWRTPTRDVLGITRPICQGETANDTSPELVAAVSGAGGRVSAIVAGIGATIAHLVTFIGGELVQRAEPQ